MPEFLVALLNALSLMDTSAQKEGQSTRSQHHRKLIRVLFILCMIPCCTVGLMLLIEWLSNLGPVAQKVAMVVGAIQLMGLLALLSRRNKA